MAKRGSTTAHSTRSFDTFMKDMESLGVRTDDPNYNYKAFHEWVEQRFDNIDDATLISNYGDEKLGGLPSIFMDEFHPERFVIRDVNEPYIESEGTRESPQVLGWYDKKEDKWYNENDPMSFGKVHNWLEGMKNREISGSSPEVRKYNKGGRVLKKLIEGQNSMEDNEAVATEYEDPRGYPTQIFDYLLAGTSPSEFETAWSDYDKIIANADANSMLAQIIQTQDGHDHSAMFRYLNPADSSVSVVPGYAHEYYRNENIPIQELLYKSALGNIDKPMSKLDAVRELARIRNK